jgi:AraC-like DNA-binding protein
MRVMQEYIDFPLQTAVKVKWRKMPHFTYPWHFHSEYEILYVIEGTGTSFVADNIEQFSSGDLAMLGNNLPHFWRSDEKYYATDSKEKVNYIVIQFPGDLFREPFFEYSEFQVIRELFTRSSKGIRFLPPFSEKAGRQVIKIARSSGFDRVILLLELLSQLARTEKFRLLAGELYQKQNHDFTSNRLTKVLHFLTVHYQQKIELQEVARIAHLHPSAFCRFFKEKTGKSLSEYVNNMRLSYACRLLLDGKLTVSEICFECGYNNVSNFNRSFKKHTTYTPTQYIRVFRGKNS